MLKEEFEQRVGIEISQEEFSKIHEQYIMSDYNKDKYCKVWAKMMATRIKEQKLEARQKNTEQKYKNLLKSFSERKKETSQWLDVRFEHKDYKDVRHLNCCQALNFLHDIEKKVEFLEWVLALRRLSTEEKEIQGHNFMVRWYNGK